METLVRARSIALLVGAKPCRLGIAGARAADPPGATAPRRVASLHVAGEGSRAASTVEPGAEPPACDAGMVLVEGDFCPRVAQRCLRWMDPPGRYHEYRCAEYAQPAQCLAPRVHKRFCIDRQERVDRGTGLPLNVQSWTDAKRACEADGARVCVESEWTFACEGEEMRPYPYGWRRAADKCNADRKDLVLADRPWLLRDERDPAGAHPDCASPFGLRLDMAGNVAEW